jgi:hypothetical protein
MGACAGVAGAQQGEQPGEPSQDAAQAPAGQAQAPAAEEEKKPSPMGDWTVTLRGAGGITFRADIDDTPGDVEVYRAGGGVLVSGPLGDRARISFDLGEEASWYLFDNATGLAPGSSDPFENVLRTTFSPRVFVVENQHWSWFVGGLFEAGGEPDADVGDSLMYGGFAGARYAVSEKLAFSFGLGAQSRLVDDVLAIPLIGVNWQISEKVNLSVEGTTLRVAAAVSEDVTLSLKGAWELREYRLDDDGALPGGAVSDARIPVGLEIEWKAAPGFVVALAGGAVVWQEFKFDDSDENEVSETNTDPTGFLGLELRWSF